LSFGTLPLPPTVYDRQLPVGVVATQRLLVVF